MNNVTITETEATIGHNSKSDINVGGIAVDRLRSLIERIERLLEEKAALTSDIKEIYAEGKSAGYNVKCMRALITLRKSDPDTVEEFELEFDTYRRALGM